jgi:hypothetical protein
MMALGAIGLVQKLISILAADSECFLARALSLCLVEVVVKAGKQGREPGLRERRK